MMRAATALIVLLSVLSAPVASAVCRDCCNQRAENQPTVCHDQAHARLSPHLHHFNQMHLVTEESNAGAVIPQWNHRLPDDRFGCDSAVCVSVKPIHAFVASALSHQRHIPAHLLEMTTIRGSGASASPSRSPDEARIAIYSSPSRSAPLRI